MSAPGQATNPQHMLALERANAVRSRRARARREVRSLSAEEAQAMVADMIERCPDWLRSEPAHILLGWLPSRGRSRMTWINRTLSQAGVFGVRPLGGLTDRQRQAIAHRLREGTS